MFFKQALQIKLPAHPLSDKEVKRAYEIGNRVTQPAGGRPAGRSTIYILGPVLLPKTDPYVDKSLTLVMSQSEKSAPIGHFLAYDIRYNDPRIMAFCPKIGA